MAHDYILGTRGSDLARWQSAHVRQAMLAAAPAAGAEITLKIITTQGDVSLAERLVGTLEKGFFTEELEAELRAGRIDLAVHSLKDLPTRIADEFTVAAVLARAAPGDILLTTLARVTTARAPGTLPLAAGTRVGASSLRRDALLKRYAPAAIPVPLRGNVPTRVQKLRDGQVDAILLARAGVERLGLDLSGLAGFALNPAVWQPAPGQGALAVECRAADAVMREWLARLDHAETRRATELERAFLRALEGGCSTPFGCYAAGDALSLGMATARGWQSLTLRRERFGGDARAIDEILTTLQDATLQERTSHDLEDWLYRPL